MDVASPMPGWRGPEGVPTGIVGKLEGDRRSGAWLDALLCRNQFADDLGLRDRSGEGENKEYQQLMNKDRHGTRQSPNERHSGPLQVLYIDECLCARNGCLNSVANGESRVNG